MLRLGIQGPGNDNGALYRLETRLAPKSHFQTPGINCNDAFARVTEIVILRLLVTVALHQKPYT
jgi:hypothetical protein